MKFGTQLSSLGEGDLPQVLQRGRELGCDGLEVSLAADGLRTGATTLEALLAQAARLREAFDAAGMEFISLSPGLMLKHAACPEVVTATGEIAQVLGCPTIRMMFSPHVRWGGPHSQLDEWMADFDGTRDSREWMRRDAESLARLLEMTEPWGLRLAVELHHGYVVNSASAALRLFDPYPPSRVGIIMDPGNMVFEGNEGWRNSVQLMGSYLAYVHCKNAQWQRVEGRWQASWDSLAGGIASFPQIITALRDLGFTGYLSIEDLRRDLSVEEKVGAGLAYLRGLLASSDRALPS